MPGKAPRIGSNLVDIAATFATVEACTAYLEAARWPHGVRRPKCQGDKNSKFTTKETFRPGIDTDGEPVKNRVPPRQLYHCLGKECKYQFSVIEGTIFKSTHLPINKWFMAAAFMLNAKKGISAKQMERDLAVSYKTAWYLCHRIRKAMREESGVPFIGTVECNETFIGGRFDKRRKRERWEKTPVLGTIHRGTGAESLKVQAPPSGP